MNNYFELADHTFTPLLSKVRRNILNEVAASYLPGFVLTHIWDLKSEADRNYIDPIVNIFEKYIRQVRFVELKAKLGTRLQRSQGEDRLREKPLKSHFKKTEGEIMSY